MEIRDFALILVEMPNSLLTGGELDRPFPRHCMGGWCQALAADAGGSSIMLGCGVLRPQPIDEVPPTAGAWRVNALVAPCPEPHSSVRFAASRSSVSEPGTAKILSPVFLSPYAQRSRLGWSNAQLLSMNTGCSHHPYMVM